MKFPLARMRRLRENDFMRRLCAETVLSTQDLIYPIFVHAGSGTQEIDKMPGLLRHDTASMLAQVEDCQEHGIVAVALFPVIDAQLKTADGSQACNSDGLIPRCIRAIGERFPQMGVLADVALDPYTDHGHDGILDARGVVDNDETTAILVQQALMLADVGCRALAPSDMMDGRVGAIRQALEAQGHHEVALITYSAKYASAFYGPFRAAIGAASQLGERGKRGYQMDPACARQALREARLDIDEGADVLMVKPAMPYLDIISSFKREFDLPIFAYQVSGEYAMIQWAAANNCGSGSAMMDESLLSIKRAGADCILSYFALDWARQHSRSARVNQI